MCMYAHMYVSTHVPFCVKSRSLGARGIPAMAKGWKFVFLRFPQVAQSEGKRIRAIGSIPKSHSKNILYARRPYLHYIDFHSSRQKDGLRSPTQHLEPGTRTWEGGTNLTHASVCVCVCVSLPVYVCVYCIFIQKSFPSLLLSAPTHIPQLRSLSHPRNIS